MFRTFLLFKSIEAATHIWYDSPYFSSHNVTQVHATVNVPIGGNSSFTYWEVLGCNNCGYYMGIQQNNGLDQMLLFSVWDADDDTPCQVLETGKNIVNNTFGGEGTGCQTRMNSPTFSWMPGADYPFISRAEKDTDTTLNGTWFKYSAYYKNPEGGKWELIATIRRKIAPGAKGWIGNSYAFLERYASTTTFAKGYWNNAWLYTTSGSTVYISGAYMDHNGSPAELESFGVENNKFMNQIYGTTDIGSVTLYFELNTTVIPDVPNGFPIIDSAYPSTSSAKGGAGISTLPPTEVMTKNHISTNTLPPTAVLTKNSMI